MQPHELIRAAAEIIKTSGWSRGAQARDTDGNSIPLFGVAVGGDSRSSVNPAARSFSIYGALVKAMSQAGEASHVGLMWDTLHRLAHAETGTPHGLGDNLHPVFRLNDAEGTTKEQVLAFMEKAAAVLEGGLSVPVDHTEAPIAQIMPTLVSPPEPETPKPVVTPPPAPQPAVAEPAPVRTTVMPNPFL